MRLTLRTLLAYLDGNLEPDDSEDIGKKIEESEFAASLVHRIRDVTRQTRLGVPAVIGRGLGADPNTVAEYLEYRLSDDRVPELEKICLESHVHLAEVASCHQILTLVLDKAAEVDPSLRERLYRISAEADGAPIATEARGATIAPVPASATPLAVAASASVAPLISTGSVSPAQSGVRRVKPEVPEYLRESRSRFWPVLATVLIVAGLTFAGLWVFGPPGLRENVMALVDTPAVETTKPNEAATDAPAASTATDQGAQATGADAAVPTTPDPRNPDAMAPDTATPDTAPGEIPPGADVGSPTPDNETPSDNPPATDAGPQPAPLEPMPANPAEPLPAQPDDTTPAPGTLPGEPGDRARPSMPLPVGPPGTAPPGTVPVPLPLPPQPDADSTPGEPAPEPGSLPPAGDLPPEGTPAEPAAAASESFGRSGTSKLEVLLKYDQATDSWVRLPAMSPLSKGDRLMALPSFQPMIMLSSNISVQADGAAQFELVGWTPEGVPILGVEYGRLLMLTVGKANNSLVIKVDGQEPELTFVDAESSLAVDVHRELPPGQDPEAGPAPMVARVYAQSGLIRLADKGSDPIELQSPSQCALVGRDPNKEVVTGGEFPAWLTSEGGNEFDSRASKEIEPNLKPDKPVALQLKELLADSKNTATRRREGKTLSIRSLVYVGDYEPAIAVLNQASEKLLWPAALDELKLAVARSPQTAAQVRIAFEKARGPEAGRALYRDLWSYSLADFKEGADRDLINGLDNEALDRRVMSILTLQQLTGKTHGYQPEAPEIKRKTAFNLWKREIGKVAPRPAPAAKGKAAK